MNFNIAARLSNEVNNKVACTFMSNEEKLTSNILTLIQYVLLVRVAGYLTSLACQSLMALPNQPINKERRCKERNVWISIMVFLQATATLFPFTLRLALFGQNPLLACPADIEKSAYEAAVMWMMAQLGILVTTAVLRLICYPNMTMAVGLLMVIYAVAFASQHK